MKNKLGIDIGDSVIKFVFNDSCLTIDTPDNAVKDGSLVTFDAMADLIKETVKENGIKQKNVCLIIPDENVFLNRLHMPKMNEKQLMVNLPYEFKELVGNNKDDYLYDYAVIDNSDGLELLAAAVEKSLIEKYSEMFTTAGLKLVKALPRQLAISNLLRKTDNSGDVGFLDLGYSHTRIDIYNNYYFNAGRNLENGVKDMCDIVSEIKFCDSHTALNFLKENDEVLNNQKIIDYYEDISVKIARAINYYTYENRDNKLETLYYYGGGSHFEKFISVLEHACPIDVKPVSYLFEGEDMLDVLDACGALED